MNLILLIPLLASFFIALFSIPYWIKRAKKAELVGKDIQKNYDSQVAESGGVVVVSAFAIGVLLLVAIKTFIFKSTDNFIEIFSLMTTILMISFIAFTDDILGWKIGLRRRTRMLLVAVATIPLVAINAGKSIVLIPFLGPTELGLLYPLILIPFGIVGATTVFNFLAGYNGLEAGQGIILLSAVSIVTFFTGNSWLSLISLCMVAALLAFLLFNFYPAKVFPGDTLTYSVGGLIAIISILGNFEKIAVFFFVPYAIEMVLKLRGKLQMQSFGLPQKDGSLDLRYPKIYSLNHIGIVLLKKLNVKSTEKRVVYLIWLFQIVIILIGFLIFRNGIF